MSEPIKMDKKSDLHACVDCEEKFSKANDKCNTCKYEICAECQPEHGCEDSGFETSFELFVKKFTQDLAEFICKEVSQIEHKNKKLYDIIQLQKKFIEKNIKNVKCDIENIGL